MLLIIVVFGKLFLQCRKLNIRLIPQSLNRGKAVPGGVCGFWGACGVGISAGVFISIISFTTSWSTNAPDCVKCLESHFISKPVIKCIHSGKNNQCIKERCPFHE